MEDFLKNSEAADSIIKHLSDYLDDKSLVNLAQTNKQFRNALSVLINLRRMAKDRRDHPMEYFLENSAMEVLEVLTDLLSDRDVVNLAETSSRVYNAITVIIRERRDASDLAKILLGQIDTGGSEPIDIPNFGPFGGNEGTTLDYSKTLSNGVESFISIVPEQYKGNIRVVQTLNKPNMEKEWILPGINPQIIKIPKATKMQAVIPRSDMNKLSQIITRQGYEFQSSEQLREKRKRSMDEYYKSGLEKAQSEMKEKEKRAKKEQDFFANYQDDYEFTDETELGEKDEYDFDADDDYDYGSDTDE